MLDWEPTVFNRIDAKADTRSQVQRCTQLIQLQNVDRVTQAIKLRGPAYRPEAPGSYGSGVPNGIGGSLERLRL